MIKNIISKSAPNYEQCNGLNSSTCQSQTNMENLRYDTFVVATVFSFYACLIPRTRFTQFAKVQPTETLAELGVLFETTNTWLSKKSATT